jgi:hypothetical protein
MVCSCDTTDDLVEEICKQDEEKMYISMKNDIDSLISSKEIEYKAANDDFSLQYNTFVNALKSAK